MRFLTSFIKLIGFCFLFILSNTAYAQCPSTLPINVNCSDAIVVPFTYGNSCITTSGTTAAQGVARVRTCGAGTGDADDQVWYELSTIHPGDHPCVKFRWTIQLTGSTAPLMIQGFQMETDPQYGYSCPEPAPLFFCNSSTPSEICTLLPTGGGTFTFDACNDKTYKFRFYTQGAGTCSPFNFCVNAVPANDEPANAITLPINAPTVLPGLDFKCGEIRGATMSIAPVVCAGVPSGVSDVWYSFNSPFAGAYYELKILDNNAQNQQNYKVEVYDQNGGVVGDYIGCGSINANLGLFCYTLPPDIQSGNTYYIRILLNNMAPSFRIILNAVEAVCQNTSVVLNAAGSASLMPSQVSAALGDNCSVQSMTLLPSTFTCLDAGNKNVTLSVNYNNGGVSFCSAIVNVQDNTIPTITCPAPQSLVATGANCQAIMPNYQIGAASDNCILNTTQSPPVGALLNPGPYSVLLTATDRGNHTVNCSFNLNVTGTNAVTYYRDQDGDGFGSTTNTVSSCTGAPVGYIAISGDCNDGAANINPNAPEICNAIDDNCNGTIDEGVQITYYRDVDGDGYGVTSITVLACSKPTGYALVGGDCNDNSNAVSPGQVEIACNSIDDNCNGTIDENGVMSTWYQDADGDTYGNPANSVMACTKPNGFVANNTDCNDNTNAVYPGKPEVCDGLDNNCNGTIDEGLLITYYRDADGDGYGATAITLASCAGIPTGYVLLSGDCNDGAANVKPGATEVCNGIDDNCNGTIDENGGTWYTDADGDGYGAGAPITTCTQPAGTVSNNTDCNDNFSSIHPGATEICNQKDDNCNALVDEGVGVTYYRDQDADGYGSITVTIQSCTGAPTGYVAISGDCNDGAANIRPNAPEICNGIDDNCNGTIDEGVQNTYYRDVDGDGYGVTSMTVLACSKPTGYALVGGDCNDTNSGVSPGQVEIACNSIDDNCNGTIDENGVMQTWYQDADGDTYGNPANSVMACTKPNGFVANNTDCNDNTNAVYPGKAEVCDGLDNNCNGTIDEGLAITYYRDADGDGYGATNVTITSCSGIPTGYVAQSGDCNDGAANVKPGATEVCNGYDDNCNGQIDENGGTWYTDADHDGFGTGIAITSCTQPANTSGVAGDCNDANNAAYPGATELCDGFDNDCDGLIDENLGVTYYRDQDGDGYGATNITIQSCNGAPSGYVALSGDCNDGAANIKPGATEICNGMDDNCNGTIDEGVQNTYYRDQDGDGYGVASNTILACSKPTGYALISGDCNDNNNAVSPGQVELACNGVDDNCNGQIDENGVMTTWYQDADGDTYGNPNNSVVACTKPNGFVTNNTDCNDQTNAVYPGKAEVCDGLDNNCNGTIDEGLGITYYRDADGDGYGATNVTINSCNGAPAGYVAQSGDCNDGAANVRPGATEVCNNIDDNCNGTIDEGVQTTYYRDQDGDGYGVTSNFMKACSQPVGYTTLSGDCNDALTTVSPGQPEIPCNGIDDNCNGTVDEIGGITYYRDQDGDGYGSNNVTVVACNGAPTGYVAVGGDCNDGAANIRPNAPEICNAIDDNCNGIIDEGVQITYYRDQDGDGYGVASNTILACSKPTGYALLSGDCNDTNAGISPGQVEIACNSIDDNCNGQIDENGVMTTWYQDADGDTYGNPNNSVVACTKPNGFVANNTDCNDQTNAVYPGKAEVCDGLDNNCNGTIDEGLGVTYYRDADGDGYGVTTVTINSCNGAPTGYVAQSGDCNDGAANIKPGATEICNNIDDNCNGIVDDVLNATKWYKDNDGDTFGNPSIFIEACLKPIGYVANNTDCNDNNAAVKPTATEICNGIDDNCNGTIDDVLNGTKWYKDNDGDNFGNASIFIEACVKPTGYVANNTDCNDNNAAINPNATEICNGIDENCNGLVDDCPGGTLWYKDNDGDGYGNPSIYITGCNQPTGYVSNKLDCNDYNNQIRPNATEICNNIDDNCNGQIDENIGLSISSTQVNNSCAGVAGGSINITVTGGIGTRTYLWNDGVTTEDREYLLAGNYSVTVTTPNSCSKTKSFTITGPNCTPLAWTHVITQTSTNPAKFSLTITATGGTPYVSNYPYRYRRSNGTGYTALSTSNVFTNLTAGTYTFEAVDRLSCALAKTLVIGAGGLTGGGDRSDWTFVAMKEKGTANLEWFSSNEGENATYEVQRACDGINFEKIETINADFTHLVQHQVTDAMPCEGDNFYRIVSKALDGNLTVSEAEKLTFEYADNHLTVFPNPTSNEIYLRVQDLPGETATLIITDLLGKEKMRLELDNSFKSAPISIQLDERFANGAYILNFKTDKTRAYSRRFVVLKE
jgi:hypothetical protein